MIVREKLKIARSDHQDQWLAGGYVLEKRHFWKWLAWWLPGGSWLFCAVSRDICSNNCEEDQRSQSGSSSVFILAVHVTCFHPITLHGVQSADEVTACLFPWMHNNKQIAKYKV